MDTTDTARPALDRRGFLSGLTRLGALGVAARVGVVTAGTAGPLLAAGPAVALGPDRPDSPASNHGPEVLQDWMRTLYSGLMDEPGMTPGRAARVYATAAVAGYEAMVPGSSSHTSLAGQLNGLGAVTMDPAGVDWPTVVSTAIGAAAADVLRAASPALRDAVATQTATHVDQRRGAGVSAAVLERSSSRGTAVGEHVAAWARSDGAEATYARPYTPPVGESLWRPTPPNFGSAIDPSWGEVRPMALRSADACAPPPPVKFRTAPGSSFHDQAMQVLAATDVLTDHDRATALFWRDNPTTSGLPSGHWMRLVAQLCGERGLALPAAAYTLVLAGVTLNDAFISCWHEKYVTNLLRPISYIQAYVEGRSTWTSFVNTPQFPEYTSGHSVASQAAAAVLTRAMGTFVFTDRTHELRNPQLGSRTYGSFQEAATEAARSRLLGGIHYPMGIDVGLRQGSRVGRQVLNRIEMRGASGR